MPHRPCRKLHAQGRSFGAVLFYCPTCVRDAAFCRRKGERRHALRGAADTFPVPWYFCANSEGRLARKRDGAAYGGMGLPQGKGEGALYAGNSACSGTSRDVTVASELSQVAAAVRSGRAVSAARLCGRARRRAASVALCAERGRRETRGRRGMRAQASSRSAVHAQCRLEAVAELAFFAGSDVDASQFQLPAQLPQPAFQAGRHVASQRALERGHV